MFVFPRIGDAGRIGGAAKALALAGLATLTLAGTPAGAMTIQKVKSPGGIEAWLVEDHTLPIVAMEFAFRGGTAHDPKGKTGLVNLMSTLLDEGAGDVKSEDFQTRLEDLSVKLSFTASRDTFGGSFRSLAGRLDEGLGLLRLAVNEPRFDDDAIERMRRRVLAQIRNADRNPQAIAGKLWYKAAFPDHPYGMPKMGTAESVGAVTQADFKDMHKRLFTRDRLKVAVVGAIDANKLATELDRVFGALPAKSDLPPVAAAKLTFPAPVSHEMTIPQTVIRFGGNGIGRKDKDFYAAYLMNYILGGGSFSSWLYDEVREKRGLAYSVYTYLATMDHANFYVGAVATRADQADLVIKLIREQVMRMVKVGPSEDELAKAKSFLIGTYALQFDTSTKIANILLGLQLDDLDTTYLTDRKDLLGKVTIDDVKRVAKRILGNGEMVISRVGQNTGG